MGSKTSIQFKYFNVNLFTLANGVCTLFALFILSCISNNINLSIPALFLVGFILAYSAVLIFFKVIEKYSLFTFDGEFFIDGDKLVFMLKNKKISLNISEIKTVAIREDKFNSSRKIQLSVVTNNKSLSIESLVSSRNDSMSTNNIMNIYNIIKDQRNDFEEIFSASTGRAICRVNDN